MKKAILFGATGFIGSYLLAELLNNTVYEQVTVVVRKKIKQSHPKLNVLIGDFHRLNELKNEMIADDVFITLGTTKKNTPSRTEYYQVDHDYPILASQIAKENGAKSVFIVTAIGANENAAIFYSKMKGEVERDLIALDFDHTHIFQPSMILGNRKENRPNEKIFQKITRIINPLLGGKLNKYKGIEGKEIALAINNATKNQKDKVKVYQWKEMQELQKCDFSEFTN